MRTGHVLLSAVNLFIALMLAGVGVFLLVLPRAPQVRFLLSSFFAESPRAIPLAGAALLLIGLCLLTGFYAMERRQYYQVAMRRHQATVDLKVIRDYAESYWRKVFPQDNLSVEILLLPQQKLEIMAEIPSALRLEEHDKLLGKVEKELGDLLAHNLGYGKEFLVTFIVR